MPINKVRVTQLIPKEEIEIFSGIPQGCELKIAYDDPEVGVGIDDLEVIVNLGGLRIIIPTKYVSFIPEK